MGEQAGTTAAAENHNNHSTTNESEKENQSTQNSNYGNNRGRGNSQKNKNINYSNEQPYGWKGRNESFGLILALKSERYEHKSLYSVFIERLKNHAIQEFTHGNDIVSLIENYEDPKDAINAQLPKDTQLTKRSKRSKGSKVSVKSEEERSDDENVPKDTYDDATDDESSDNIIQSLVIKELVKNHINRLTKLDMNKMKLYGLIWGQLTTGLQEVIKGDEDFSDKDLQFDCIWLLIKCKLITAGLDERANKHSTYVTAVRQAFSVRQRENESNDAYRKRFESQSMILDLVGGKHVMSSPTILGLMKYGNATAADIIKEEQKTKAMMLILGADPSRFQHLQDSLEEGVLLGRDEYPITITQAYELLQSTCPHLNQSSNRFSRFKKGGRFRMMGNLSFAQVKQGGTSVPGRDNRVFEHITCHGCQERGHYRNQCPTQKNVTLTQFVLNQQQLATINPNWILLDTCSTVSVFCNRKLIHDIQPCEPNQELHIITNGGSETFPYTATSNLLPIPVHFNPHSLANILSLSSVANIPGARITMDTHVEKAILLHVNGQTYKFLECQDGLYFYDTKHLPNHSNNMLSNYSAPSSYHFLQRVDDNKAFYTRRQIEGADTARRIQASIGFPSTPVFKQIIQNNLIRNCGITSDDISRAERIYGPLPPLLQGKSTRSKPKPINIHHIPLPLQIQERHNEISLHIDFFYVNGLPFLHTKSEHINFLTVQTGKTRNTSSITQGLNTVINLYHKRGLKVKNIFGDNEFDIQALHNSLLPVILHIFAAGEHCPIAERSIRTVKERCRCVCHSVPFKRYTKLMVYMLVESIIYWLNSFPAKEGVSSTISPAGIVTGRNLPDFNNKQIPFGAYAWVFTKTTNTMKSRRVPAIALGPSNEWGGHYFMSLYTGKKLHSYDWVETPIDDEVIARVEELAEQEGQPIITDNMPLFEWGLGKMIVDEDNEYENDFFSSTEEETPSMDVVPTSQQLEIHEEGRPTEPHSIPILEDTAEGNELASSMDDLGPDPDNPMVGDEHDPESTPIDQNFDLNTRYEEMEAQLDHEINEIQNMSDHYTHFSDDDTSNDTNHSSPENTIHQTNDPDVEDNDHNAETGNVRRTTRRNAGKIGPRLLMDTRGKDYKTVHFNLLMKQKRIARTKKKVVLTMLKRRSNYITQNGDIMQKAIGIIFAQQMSAKKGIKKFGEKAIAALMKEFSQLDQGAFPGKPVIQPTYSEKLTTEERRRALEAVNIIAEKRCGKLKGRTCADGSKQRRYLKHDESVASPTISLESLISTLLIDAHEG